jgi:phage terminase large subunit-like protein
MAAKKATFMAIGEIFTEQFCGTLEMLVRGHHSVYDEIPPRDIYFEYLVEKAARLNRVPFTPIQPTARNQPRHDLEMDGKRLSIKSETGESTRRNFITMTKLLTTERDPWEADSLIERTMRHLSRYDYILMLRAIWERPVIHYQLVDISVNLLRLIQNAHLQVIQRRAGDPGVCRLTYIMRAERFFGFPLTLRTGSAP